MGNDELRDWVRKWRSTRANLLALARTAYLNSDPDAAKRRAQIVLVDIRRSRPTIDRAVRWSALNG